MILITITSLAILTALMIFSKLNNKSLAPLYSFGFVLLVSLGTAMCSTPTDNVMMEKKLLLPTQLKNVVKKIQLKNVANLIQLKNVASLIQLKNVVKINVTCLSVLL